MKEKVLITGVTGTLGRAFLRLLHEKYDVVGIDFHEWGIAELKNEYPNTKFILGDFVNWCYEDLPVDYIIACGAYKHLPLGETDPLAFIENNIVKTAHLFKEAANYCELLFISTDKAVEPISLYGYTKAIGEHLAKYYGFSVARLGNILDSSGSVIPVWEDCIKKNLPVKITDERMSRYFIEDMDAVNQLWHEFIQGKKLIIPKCEEIRLMDLLALVLDKHGYTTTTYAPGVEIIGMRDKEKLQEKLRWDFEEEAV